MVDKKSPNYTWFVRLGDRFMDATGIIANTAEAPTSSNRPGPLATIADSRCVQGRTAQLVYPIGPVLPPASFASQPPRPPAVSLK
jgi:hypothetical protein